MKADTDRTPKVIEEVVLRLFKCYKYDTSDNGNPDPEIVETPPWPWEPAENSNVDVEFEYELLPEFVNLIEDGEIDIRAVKKIESLLKPFESKYDKFVIMLAGGYGEHSWYPFVPHVIGKRLETKEEVEKRVSESIRLEEEKKIAEENIKKKKEEKKKAEELALLKSLQDKYKEKTNA